MYHLIWFAVPPRLELNARTQKGFKVKAGTTVLLEADVFGKPMPKVTWKRGDDRLKSAEGQLITQQRHHFQMEMTEVTKEHTGTYTILAENASGSKTADIQVNVLGDCFHLSLTIVLYMVVLLSYVSINCCIVSTVKVHFSQLILT